MEDYWPEYIKMARTISHSQWFLAPYCIGSKLRILRLQKQLTLARLAAETGLSTALLSKLETDRMVPTLSTLAAICRIYGVGLGHFFSDPGEHSLSVTRNVASQGRGRTSDASARIPLNPGVTDRKMDACLIDLAGGGAVADAGIHPDSALMVYVLEGRLHLDVGGMRETLESGDCAYLEGDMPVAWGAGGKLGCRLLTVTPGSQTSHRGIETGDGMSSQVSANK